MSDLPAPLTDLSVDVSGLSGFILDTDRLANSELLAGSTGDEFKAAVRLWCKAWHQKPVASLPDDDKVLADFAGLGVDVRRWQRLRAVALRGFVKCSDGRFYHPVLAEDAKRAHKNRQQKKDAANQRWKSDSNPDGPTDGRAPHDAPHKRSTSARNADAMPVQSSTETRSNLEINHPRNSGSGGSPLARPRTIAGRVGLDWGQVVTRMQSHGFSAEEAWTLVMSLGDRADLGKRMQGAMRKAEERGKVAYQALIDIAGEARAA